MATSEPYIPVFSDGIVHQSDSGEVRGPISDVERIAANTDRIVVAVEKLAELADRLTELADRLMTKAGETK